MYRNKFPKVGEIVFVKLENTADNYVKLIDYDLTGLVLCTEITKYISELKSVVRQNEIFPVIVMNIDDDGKNIDLSYSKIKNDKREFLKNTYNNQHSFYKFIKSIDTDEQCLNEFIETHISPNNYDESNINNKNIPKETYDKFLIEPELFTHNNKIINHVKSKVLLKPYECIQEFKLSVSDDNSLIKLKEILNKIKNITGDNELLCKSSPIYQIKIKGIDLNKIKNDIDPIKNKILEIIKDTHYTIFSFGDYYVQKQIEIIIK